MTDHEKGELLVQIKAQLDALVKAFEESSKAPGFARCVEREQRIMRLEQDVVSMKPIIATIDVLKRTVEIVEKAIDDGKKKKDQFDTWLVRATWVAIIAGIIKFAFFNVK